MRSRQLSPVELNENVSKVTLVSCRVGGESTLKVPPLTGHLLRYQDVSFRQFPPSSQTDFASEWPYPIKIACNWPEETSRLLALTLSTVENSNFARLCWPCQKIPFISRSMAVYPVRDVRVSSPKMFQRLVKWHKRGQLFCAVELHSCT